MMKWLARLALAGVLLFAVVMAFNIAAEVIYDWPVTFELRADDPNEDAEAFLRRKLWYLGAEFRYVGYSTEDKSAPDKPMYFDWYEAELPGYMTWGAEAFARCLVHREEAGGGFDAVKVYFGSPRGMASCTIDYEYSFHRVD